MRRTTLAISALACAALVGLSGCTEAMFALRADSPIPEVWKNDARLQKWKHYGVIYETRTGGDGIAHIGPVPAPWYHLWGWFWLGSINEHGTREVENLERKPRENLIVRWTFKGITERYELVPPGPDEIGVTMRLLPPATTGLSHGRAPPR